MIDSLQTTYRILDASANRAGEGLRTLEEMARFVLDDAVLTSQIKSIRHDLTSAMSRLDRQRLLRSRDTPGDVGTTIGHQTEYQRSGAAEIVAAASARTTQSLRVLEEYGKTIDPAFSAEIEQVRYRCYTVGAQLELSVADDPSNGGDRRARLHRSCLYVLIDAGEDADKFGETVHVLCKAGVDLLQLRDRSQDDRTLIGRARLGTEISREYGTLFVVNDRADLAMAADADGVHVGQEELPVADARRIVGPERLVGLSTHSIAQAHEAVDLCADYIGCGPVFAGQTKTFDDYVGTQLLEKVAAEIELPAFAIGGIHLENVDQVIDARCRRIAVSGVVRDAADPAAVVRRLKEKLQKR